MLFICFLTSYFLVATLSELCDVRCANVFDYVCGKSVTIDGTQIIMKYQNLCFMRKKQCELRHSVLIYKMPDEYCDIHSEDFDKTGDEESIRPYAPSDGRRVYDFSIVGAHQACNHTCPTYCTETYEPACAQIWKNNMASSTYRPMINHCHIDLFSCAAGVNVTIQPLGKCFKNPTGLLFMMQVAALKSLHLLSDNPFRRSDGPNADNTLWKLVTSIFKRYGTSENEQTTSSTDVYSPSDINEDSTPSEVTSQ